MSISALNYVLEECTQDKPTSVLLLLVLANYANENDEAWPSVATLAARARMSERAVQYALRKLVADGDLVVIEEGGRRGGQYFSTKYRIVRGANRAPLTEPGVQTTTVRGANHDGSGVHGLHPNHQNNHQNNHRGSEQSSEPQSARTRFLYEEDLAAWLEHHEQVTGMRPPAARSKMMQTIRAMYGARRNEGFTAEDLRHASIGAYNDTYRRQNGYYGHESVLRPTKIHPLIEKGRLGVRGPVTMHDREQSMRRAAAVPHDEQVTHLQNLVQTVLYPPPPGAVDIFNDDAPLMQADEARRLLATEVLEGRAKGATTVDEVIEMFRSKADEFHRIMQRGLNGVSR